jgi:histidinol-phosphate aminotransferase
MAISLSGAASSLGPPQHGGLDYRALKEAGVSPDEVLDFSVCTNPFGPSPAVLEAVAKADVARYPDSAAWALRERLATHHGLHPEQVLVTSGASQAIWLVALSLAERGRHSLILGPTFAEYAYACQLAGGRVLFTIAPPAAGFRPDCDRAVQLVRRFSPQLVWLCNPNNPTGLYCGPQEVAALLAACAEVGALLVIDEAYVNFTPQGWDAVPLLESAHLVLIRSMTKDYALAGLRLGYILAPSTIIEALARVQPPWSIASTAQEAGIAALESLDYYRRTWQELRALTQDLREGLLALGYNALPTDANFFLVEVGSASSIREELWQERILVRSCSSFGLPTYVRLGTRLPAQNAKLLEALRALAAKAR